jgi:hypothetical protein
MINPLRLSVQAMLGDRYNEEQSVFWNLGALEIEVINLRSKVRNLEAANDELHHNAWRDGAIIGRLEDQIRKLSQ